jgi:hypothetical protein
MRYDALVRERRRVRRGVQVPVPNIHNVVGSAMRRVRCNVPQWRAGAHRSPLQQLDAKPQK